MALLDALLDASAFHSDAHLVTADQMLRSGPLQQLIKAHPEQTLHKIKAYDVSTDVGRGYVRVGVAKYNPDTAGPPQFLPAMTRTTGVYEKNAATGIWETITIYPDVSK